MNVAQSKIQYFLNNSGILAIALGLAFLNGILNINHLLPSTMDLYIGLQCAMIVAIGIIAEILIPRFWQKKYHLFHKTIKFSYGYVFIALLYLFVLLLFQPVINDITYPDNLFMPLATIALAVTLHIIISNIENKELFINLLAIVIGIGAVLECITQFVQLFGFSGLYGTLVLEIAKGERPIGNIAQPNLAGFLYTIGIVSILYLTSLLIDKKGSQSNLSIKICSVVCIFFLMMGIGISGSRGGMVLGGASCILYFLFVTDTLSSKSRKIIGMLILLSIGIVIGGALLSHYSVMLSAVERIALGSDKPLRLYQLEQAWLVFMDSPIDGSGWENYSKGGVIHAQEIPWFTYSSYSHMLISQVASELGILGLLVFIPIGLLLIKRLSFRLSPSISYCYSVVGLYLLYSMSEYPLWYFIQFIMFIVMISLIDVKLVNKNKNIKPLIIIFSLLYTIGALIYYQSYKHFTMINPMAATEEEKSRNRQIIASFPKLWGFTQFNESLQYALIDTTQDNLQHKIILGSKLIYQMPTEDMLLNQMNLAVANGQREYALVLVKNSCIYNFSHNCNKIEQQLHQAAQQYPNEYGWIYNNFEQWHNQNSNKTRLK